MSAKCQKRTLHFLFDHLIGDGEQRRRHGLALYCKSTPGTLMYVARRHKLKCNRFRFCEPSLATRRAAAWLVYDAGPAAGCTGAPILS